MDDPKKYGEEIYRIGFGSAVEKDLLSDYKVLILTLSETDIPPALQSALSGEANEISTDDATKLIGCINALSKQIIGDGGIIRSTDPLLMKRAVAFCPKIVDSKAITDAFNTFGSDYTKSLASGDAAARVTVKAQHIDGTMNAPQRDALLQWLKDEPQEKECRVLTNVRCLSEGVDVPSLDAVLFLSPRNSQIDVVQSVGRVMRKAPGKKYGYIIIPVVIPAGIDANEALDDNERFKVVWTVLNALRAHDDRFNATVNKIELNKKKPDNIIVGRIGGVAYDKRDDIETVAGASNQLARQLTLQFEELQGVIFGRMVQKVGDRHYWEQWAKSVGEIAVRFTERITRLVAAGGAETEVFEHQKAFNEFVAGLRKNINPSISKQDAIEMLSQHIITKPVFDALFEGYSFVKNNAISVSMQNILDILEKNAVDKDTEILDRFYEFVKRNVAALDNAAAKQSIIVRLYDNFFKIAFPKMVERLGIVYTPVEIVDFIIHSVDDVLKAEFDRSLSSENVNILDPFTGTGTFITRLLQSGLISKEYLKRKYENEIFANEIVLLAYYIAAVNIENAYHDAMGASAYTPFGGICLTDTFQLGESEDSGKLFSEVFKQNSERVERQRKAPITVIVGNPPYSVGQKSENDNAKNQIYPKLEQRIAETYVAESKAANKKNAYDSYIKAFRWASDRIKDGGVIAFITNSGWLESNGMNGFRKCLEKDFSKAFVFNLRGAIRGRAGEAAKKEGQNVFNIMTGVAITLLVKNPKVKTEKAAIFYHDIGDYLNREKKLEIIKTFVSVSSSDMKWVTLTPNEHGDWINLRNDVFSTLIPLEPDNKFDAGCMSFFTTYSNGTVTSRDAWVYNFSKTNLFKNMEAHISFYNQQVDAYQKAKQKNSTLDVDSFKNNDAQKIAWSSSLVDNLRRGNKVAFEKESVRIAAYRPFTKQFIYIGDKMIHRPAIFKQFFPSPSLKNLLICVEGPSSGKDFSCIITDCIPDFHLNALTQRFPLYWYEEQKDKAQALFDKNTEYTRRDGVSDFILGRARQQYGNRVTKEDIFYYVYGFLHSRDYRAAFANDLKKMLPRLPLVDKPADFWAFSKAGRALAELHLNYETVPPCPGVTVTGEKSKLYTVEKMRFPAKDRKDTIIYNSAITVSNIPAAAYEYVVNGKSAIEWVMERYQVKTDTASGIKNDPNDWAREHGNPRYILDLLLSVINVSVQTVGIVQGLPGVEFGGGAA
jgi:predicted helicase